MTLAAPLFAHFAAPKTRLEKGRQAALVQRLSLSFFGGLGPGFSKRNWVRSLMACARIRPFCRQCPMVFIEGPHACSINSRRGTRYIKTAASIAGDPFCAQAPLGSTLASALALL